MGKGNASAIATLVERTSRYVLLQRLPYDHSAERMAYALSVVTGSLTALLKQSRTWDQGREMARHAAFTTMTGIPVFFGYPHSPWPRGTNDNTNGLLREYFPQGTDFSVYDQNYLDGAVALVGRAVGQAGPVQPRQARRPLPRSEFAGFRYPPEIIAVAVRWYLRYSLSYRDVEELLAERGIDVDHVTIYRGVQRFTLLFIDV